jgi:hypothetical protein
MLGYLLAALYLFDGILAGVVVIAVRGMSNDRRA